MSNTTTHDVMVAQTEKAGDLLDYFQGHRAALESDRAAHGAAVHTFIKNGAANFPLAPNLLAGTKKFATLCGGRTNTPVDVFDAHDGSAWSAALVNGARGTGTIEVVTLDKLAAKGIAFGGDLAQATNGPDGDPPWYGSDFGVALLDVSITANQANGKPAQFFVLNQGCPRFTGWYKGGFKTQAACFVNVIGHSGITTFHPSYNMSATLTADADLKGKGWTYLHNTKTGWGGCHQPRFVGKGTMKVALALPYVGTGDHGGAFIYAQSLGRYTHGDDRLPAGVAY